ncbi:MAG TPA: glycosyltransferase family 4 protein [Ktedonobacteraceae bacterium]|jgi:glycosyltransferase involved in cell wall biosynthesis
MSKKKKILIIVENSTAPSDPRIWHEAQELRRCGYEVSIICPRDEKHDQEAYICIDAIHIYRYKPSGTVHKATDYFKEYAAAMFKIFGLSFKVWYRHGFDAIHVANPPDIFFAMGWFYWLFGKKYVFDQHDLTPEVFQVKFQGQKKFIYKVLRFMELCSYRTANMVITTNESQKRIAIERGHCHPEKVFVVRNGPDLEHYTLATSEPALKMGHNYLLAYVGVMSKQDGVENTLYAMQELVHRRGRKDTLLVLMGDGDQFQYLKELAHKLELDEHVHFAGWVTKADILRYLSATDIGLSPDPSNDLNDHSTMLKTMEYMAMGKPVVAFDLPETRYSAQDAALYATSNRIEEFADQIEILLDNEEVRLQMGAAGRQRIEKDLCWDRTKEVLGLAYGSLFQVDPKDLSKSRKGDNRIEKNSKMMV